MKNIINIKLTTLVVANFFILLLSFNDAFGYSHTFINLTNFTVDVHVSRLSAVCPDYSFTLQPFGYIGLDPYRTSNYNYWKHWTNYFDSPTGICSIKEVTAIVYLKGKPTTSQNLIDTTTNMATNIGKTILAASPYSPTIPFAGDGTWTIVINPDANKPFSVVRDLTGKYN